MRKLGETRRDRRNGNGFLERQRRKRDCFFVSFSFSFSFLLAKRRTARFCPVRETTSSRRDVGWCEQTIKILDPKPSTEANLGSLRNIGTFSRNLGRYFGNKF